MLDQKTKLTYPLRLALTFNRRDLARLLGLWLALAAFPAMKAPGLCQTLPAGWAETELPRIQRIDLLNGFRVLVVEKSAGEKAFVNLLIKAGSAADPPYKEGLASLTASSLFAANQKISPERLKDELEFLGARLRPRVDTDATEFHAEVSSSSLDAFLTLLTNLVVRPIFSGVAVDRAKRELSDSSHSVFAPEQASQKRLREVLFERTPCGRPTQGSVESIAKLNLVDVEKFHQTYYVPNNAALIVIGGHSTNRLGGLVREKFGRWIKTEFSQPDSISDLSITSRVIQIIDQKDSEDAILTLGNPGPPRQTPDHQALTALTMLLEGIGPGSRLEKLFRSRNVPYRSLKAEFHSMKTCGEVRVTAQVPVNFLRLAIQAVLDSIEGVKSEPVTESELALVKSVLLTQHKASVNSDASLRNLVSEIELHDLARDFLVAFPSRVERLSPERIQEAAKNYLSSTRIAVVVVGDAEKLKAELTGFGSFEFIEDRESKPAASAVR
jgi:zinc protease